MKIPLFEILALIFVLWPLIQRFLDKNKKAEQVEDTEFESIGGIDEPGKSAERAEWDRAMRELESIFTGEPIKEPAKQAPTQVTVPTPVVVSSPRPDLGTIAKEAPKQVHSFYEERLQRNASDEFVDHTPVILSSDTIYKSLDDEVIVEDEVNRSHSILSDIKDRQRIREFYVMKEVLDKPRSIRPVRSRLLTS